MSQWAVRLEGTAGVLRDLPRFLPTRCSVAEQDGATYLECVMFRASMSAEELMGTAERLVEATNLVAGLHNPDWQAVRCDSARRVREDGTRLHIKLVSAQINVSASLTCAPTVIRADGAVEHPLPPASHNGESDVVLADANLRRALKYFSDPTWANLYKAYEIVRTEAGGDQRIQELGWASGAILSRFRRTCQSPTSIGDDARHAVEPSDPPSRPLPRAEAKRLAAGLLECWVRRLVERDPAD